MIRPDARQVIPQSEMRMSPRNGRAGIGRTLTVGLVVVILAAAAVSAYAVFSYYSAKLSLPVLACGSEITADTTLSANIGPCSWTGLVIGQDGITLNCAEHSIIGTGANDTSSGVDLTMKTGVTIKNCNVMGFGGLTGIGFSLSTSSNNTLRGNTADKDFVGFSVKYASNNNVLTGNTADNNSRNGFLLLISYKHALDGNKADNDKNYVSTFTAVPTTLLAETRQTTTTTASSSATLTATL